MLGGVLSCGGVEICRTSSFGIGGGRRLGLLLFVLLPVSMFEFKALQHCGSWFWSVLLLLGVLLGVRLVGWAFCHPQQNLATQSSQQHRPLHSRKARMI